MRVIDAKQYSIEGTAEIHRRDDQSSRDSRTRERMGRVCGSGSCPNFFPASDSDSTSGRQATTVIGRSLGTRSRTSWNRLLFLLRHQPPEVSLLRAFEKIQLMMDAVYRRKALTRFTSDRIVSDSRILSSHLWQFLFGMFHTEVDQDDVEHGGICLWQSERAVESHRGSFRMGTRKHK